LCHKNNTFSEFAMSSLCSASQAYIQFGDWIRPMVSCDGSEELRNFSFPDKSKSGGGRAKVQAVSR
jgi:hypothetical protein